ncbi:MAG: PD40 domain-containing protein [Gemmatimonadetes bacterium]|nr:PD40 domain-containing protein [Gemmatimonadota bacterium]
MRWRLALCLAAGGVDSAAAQSPPGTDVFVASVRRSGGSWQFGPARNLTARQGYDNQPAFSPDGRWLLITAVHPGGPNGTTQADIFRIDPATGASTPLTQTPESEYSATPMPGGREFAVIRVEVDSTQRLWAFPFGAGTPRRLLDRVKPVGYQAWLDAGTVGVFVLGSPATLQVADLATGQARILLSGVGRAIHKVPGRRALSITQLVADNTWWIMEVDPVTAAARPVARLLDGAEYYVWLPDGSLLSAKGNVLYRREAAAGAEWSAIHTFPGLSGISRLALSPRGDRLAFVAEDPKP